MRHNARKQDIHYSILDANYGLPLTAKTDLGARRQARKIAKAHGLSGYVILFSASPMDAMGGSTHNLPPPGTAPGSSWSGAPD